MCKGVKALQRTGGLTPHPLDAQLVPESTPMFIAMQCAEGTELSSAKEKRHCCEPQGSAASKAHAANRDDTMIHPCKAVHLLAGNKSKCHALHTPNTKPAAMSAVSQAMHILPDRQSKAKHSALELPAPSKALSPAWSTEHTRNRLHA